MELVVVATGEGFCQNTISLAAREIWGISQLGQYRGPRSRDVCDVCNQLAKSHQTLMFVSKKMPNNAVKSQCWVVVIVLAVGLRQGQ